MLPDYREIFSEVQSLASENKNDEAVDLLMEQGKPTLKKLTDAVESLVELNVSMGNDAAQTMTITACVLLAIMILIIIICVIVALRIAASEAKMFADPISRVKEASAELAQGNLPIEIDKMYSDEIGEMTDSFKEASSMIDTYIQELSRILGEVSNGNQLDYRIPGGCHEADGSRRRTDFRSNPKQFRICAGNFRYQRRVIRTDRKLGATSEAIYIEGSIISSRK